MVLVFFLSFFIFIFIFILFYKFCLTIDIVVEKKEIIKITLSLFKILKTSYYIKIYTDFPKFKIEYIKKNKVKTLFEMKKTTIKKEKRKMNHYLPLLNQFELNYIDLNLELGFKDAYRTSMTCGFINIFVYSIIAVIEEKNKNIIYKYKLKPVFEYPIFNISLNCIICFHLANIIYEFIKIKRR